MQIDKDILPINEPILRNLAKYGIYAKKIVLIDQKIVLGGRIVKEIISDELFDNINNKYDFIFYNPIDKYEYKYMDKTNINMNKLYDFIDLTNKEIYNDNYRENVLISKRIIEKEYKNIYLIPTFQENYDWENKFNYWGDLLEILKKEFDKKTNRDLDDILISLDLKPKSKKGISESKQSISETSEKKSKRKKKKGSQQTETPTPSEQTPTPSEQTPTPSEQTPTPSEQTPTPSEQTPTPSEQTPTLTEQTPTPTEQTPTPTEQTPTPSVETSDERKEEKDNEGFSDPNIPSITKTFNRFLNAEITDYHVRYGCPQKQQRKSHYQTLIDVILKSKTLTMDQKIQRLRRCIILRSLALDDTIIAVSVLTGISNIVINNANLTSLLANLTAINHPELTSITLHLNAIKEVGAVLLYYRNDNLSRQGEPPLTDQIFIDEFDINTRLYLSYPVINFILPQGIKRQIESI